MVPACCVLCHFSRSPSAIPELVEVVEQNDPVGGAELFDASTANLVDELRGDAAFVFFVQTFAFVYDEAPCAVGQSGSPHGGFRLALLFPSAHVDELQQAVDESAGQAGLV